MLALALGLALGAESPGGPSKVTADTGKVAAPLEEEASSLGFAKVSAFAEGAASEVVGRRPNVRSKVRRPTPRIPRSIPGPSVPRPKLIIPSLIPTACVVVKFGYRVDRPIGPVVLTKVRPLSCIIRRVKFFSFNRRNTVTRAVACKVSCLTTRPANRSRARSWLSFSFPLSFSSHKVPMLIPFSRRLRKVLSFSFSNFLFLFRSVLFLFLSTELLLKHQCPWEPRLRLEKLLAEVCATGFIKSLDLWYSRITSRTCA